MTFVPYDCLGLVWLLDMYRSFKLGFGPYKKAGLVPLSWWTQGIPDCSGFAHPPSPTVLSSVTCVSKARKLELKGAGHKTWWRRDVLHWADHDGLHSQSPP